MTKDKRKNMLQVRLSDEEKLMIERRADEEGMAPSTFVRVRMLEYCKKANKEE